MANANKFSRARLDGGGISTSRQGTNYTTPQAPARGKPGDTWTNPKTGMTHTWNEARGMWTATTPTGVDPLGRDNVPNTGDEKGMGGDGLFDPKITAIDTTNPHALPIIQMLSGWLTKMGSRAPDPRRGRGGPMAQLYGGGTRFNPTGVTPGLTPSDIPPPNDVPTGGQGGGGLTPTGGWPQFPSAKFSPVSEGSRMIRSYQPQYMNQHTANNFDPEAFLRGL